ncbi:very short patch repair endonuclease [Trichlorobacter ammonificans]|uniref:very short patch repair endonuclease n=1 Tax=Trichlorobacter ammonificans TaxID=2916410 RepID=UPI0035ABB009
MTFKPEEASDSDVLTPTQRSYCMSRIRGKNTRPEILLRKAVWARGCRYRLKNSLPGNPDFTFPQKKVAVFVDGCFWHGCPEHWIKPQKNNVFWESKIQGNISRDKIVCDRLNELGWTVIRIWEHEIKANVSLAAERIFKTLQSL